MDNLHVSAETRMLSGKSSIRRMKLDGMVPGVLYDNGKSIPITVRLDEIRNIIDKYGEDITLDLDYNGERMNVRIKEVQRDPLTGDIQHIDLMPVIGNVLH